MLWYQGHAKIDAEGGVPRNDRHERRRVRAGDVILALIGRIALALGHDRDGRPDEGGGYDGQSLRIWPTNV